MTSGAAPMFARLAEIWAASDPQKALAWAESLDFEEVRSQALLTLYPEWAKHDREGAFAALDRVPGDSLRRKMFDEMAWEVISGDLPNAEKWVRSLEGDQQSSRPGPAGRTGGSVRSGAGPGAAWGSGGFRCSLPGNGPAGRLPWPMRSAIPPPPAAGR